MTAFLEALGIEPVNPGVCLGPGRWLDDPTAPLLESVNPATGEVIARVRAGTPSGYEALVSGAAAAFARWREVPAPRRGQVVRRIGEALRRHKDALGSLVALESGKIKAEGDGEVQEMIDMADLAVGQSRMLYGLAMHSERPGHRLYEQWHPLGVAGVLTAFNFPVAVWAWNALLAAVCGNVVVWRPSPKAPLTAVAVQHLCNRVLAEEGFEGVFSLLVDAGDALGRCLAADRRVPLVSFTGSTAVGREVAETVAARLGRSLLELSGNNAVVLDETADLELAVPAIVFGAVGTAGQRCTTTRRLLVHAARIDEVGERLRAAYRQVRIGDPLAPGVLMGPLIDAAAVAAFQRAVSELRAAGGQVLHGGRALEGPGFFVEPTLARMPTQCEIVCRETFAPILYLIPWRKLDEAIALNNAVAQGLSSAIFTEHLGNAERFLSATGSDCGIANVNVGTSGAEIGGAFGGEKDTGGGREAGSDAWKAYMRRQTCTVNWSGALPLAQGIKFDLGEL